jgi:coenzyme F420-0:L-glutamate ligase / coenzyme F420-1:gamma-L-glutamate ligase
MSRRMTLTALAGFPTIQPNDDLAALIVATLGREGLVVEDGDVFVVAQKIVSKAEGRRVSLNDVVPSSRAIELATIANKDPRVVELILQESVEVVRCRPGVVIVEHRSGLVMANAGIDASNVDGQGGDFVLLLPKDADKSAADLRKALHGLTRRDVGVVINDSFGRAWRNGTVGTAIGLDGAPGVWDMRGHPDRNGRILMATEVGIADELAAAASLLMGQGSEGLPVVHVRGLPLPLRSSSLKELIRDRSLDLFR